MRGLVFAVSLLLMTLEQVLAGGILTSKHNLSASGPGPVKAATETQVCVFCHTPHGGDQTADAPLWNRQLSTATYTPYLSSSTDANPLPGPPGGSSKVCLSCHDGTLAIGSVASMGSIAMNNTGVGGVIPSGLGADTGFTRNLGTDLGNDHPVSFTYNSTLVSNDGELRTPGNNVVGDPTPSNKKPTFPLEVGQIQCATCHDPHISESGPSQPPLKFLRGSRIQNGVPLGGYVQGTDIMCLACHDKDKGVAMWANSAHANTNVANETYTNAAAATRDFLTNTQVWQASCLNCHDAHTVKGARHLLREGTDSLSSPKGAGNSAIEETCYQCHSTQGVSILNQSSPPNIVPDIKTEFSLTYHMPIALTTETHDVGGNFNDSIVAPGVGLANGTAATCNSSGSQCGKDLMESEAVLGKPSAGGLAANRHTECTDCHNPHRATKKQQFNTDATTPDAAGTHKHNILIGDTAPHSNIASGALRGSFGVEPKYNSAEFGTPGIPINFDVKRGDPGLSGTTNVSDTYVTREYQVCFKCHSNYGFDAPDLLGNVAGGAPHGTNGFDTYLNTAMELQAPLTHQGAPASTSDSGAYLTYYANNHRSWHPVKDVTGRTPVLRGNASPNLWRAPWNGSDLDGGSVIVNAVGAQTMFCSDCHGSYNAIGNGVVPDGNGSPGAWTEDGKPWGPHGSTETFILKGPSNTASAIVSNSDTLCFRCHDAAQYADATGTPATVLQSGFSAVGTDVLGSSMSNLHQRHAYYTSTAGISALGANTVWPAAAANTYRCTMCHTGTAHGWKNKEFLVNLNDLGPELDKNTNSTVGGALGGETAPGPVVLAAGQNVPKGTQAIPDTTFAPVPTGYTNGPYYQGALLYINNFKPSGSWTKADCANSGCH